MIIKFNGYLSHIFPNFTTHVLRLNTVLYIFLNSWCFIAIFQSTNASKIEAFYLVLRNNRYFNYYHFLLILILILNIASLILNAYCLKLIIKIFYICLWLLYLTKAFLWKHVNNKECNTKVMQIVPNNYSVEFMIMIRILDIEFW